MPFLWTHFLFLEFHVDMILEYYLIVYKELDLTIDLFQNSQN